MLKKQGHPTGIFEKKTKQKQQQSMTKASEAILSSLGDCWETSVPHS